MRYRSHPLGILLVGTVPWIMPKATKGARGGGGWWKEGWAVLGSSHLPLALARFLSSPALKMGLR